jgi:sterol 3beta-glucosyltransferase
MNIVVSTFGVRGDVQPYLALAVGLQDAGHRVTLAT